MEMSVGTSGYFGSVLNLLLVSQRNLPLTVILVSAPSSSQSSPFPHRSKGYIYRGRAWYVSSPGNRETTTHIPPQITVTSIGTLSLPRSELHR